MRIKDFVKCNLNNLFYREYRLRRKVRRHLLPYYKEAFPVGKNTNKMIVFMADGRISKFGSVKVEKLHSIERYSHVMHIGSTVRGEIDEKHDALDAIEAVLPAGTLSGAPKIRACQLIGELENNKRGIYGGAIGYIDFTGNMDTCIAIRIAYRKNGKVFVRSGAGIVADSDPKKEFEECLNKARAALKALEMAQEEEL
jgi:anthranilate synthase component 1